jgi:hypothetical protein
MTAMVVLIGEGWADVLNEKGERRIDNPNDFVRFEIGRALTRGIPVLPVLIDGAGMPAVAQLPQALAPLTFLQAMPLRMESFDEDADRIARRLRFLIAQARPRGLPVWQIAAMSALALAAGIMAGPPVLVKLGLPLPFVALNSGTNSVSPSGADNEPTEALRALLLEHEQYMAELRTAWAQLRASLSEAEKRNPGAFAQVDRLLAPTYTSNLSFVNVDSKSVMVAGDADLINSAVVEGMKALSALNPKYAFNAPGHTLPNNDANARKLSTIFWDADLSRAEKVDRIVNELMVPGGVAGQFKRNPDGSVNLRPFVVSRATKNLVSESRTFKTEEFDCKDAYNPRQKLLCEKAVEDIRDTVIRLLKQL